MIVENLENFELFGVYKITNIKNNKIYVGSTTRSFKERFTEHSRDLSNKSHKNYYLQSSYNKHGNNNFKFEILEIVDNINDIYIIEQKYIDELCINKKVSYNINLKATGQAQHSEEVRKKAGKTFKNTLNTSIEYSKKIKDNEITIDDVPEKYKKLALHYLTPRDSSKSRTKEKGYTFEHLKVPKTISNDFKRARKISAIKNRENRTPYVKVYDTFGIYINTFRSCADIYEYSIKYPDYFPTLDKNNNSRSSKGQLNAINISACCNNKSIHYKGLQFKYVGSNKEIKFLKLKDLNSKIVTNKKIQRRENNIVDRYSRLLEQFNMKNSLNSVNIPKQDNTEPSTNLNV